MYAVKFQENHLCTSVVSKPEKNHIETNANNEDSQTGIRCCDNSPAFTITYDVAGVYKTYSVCMSCSRLDCFSKFIIKKIPITNKILKNKIKNSKSVRVN